MTCFVVCCLLLVCCCTIAWTLVIKERNQGNKLDLLRNTPNPALTCTGLSNDTVVWSIRDTITLDSVIGNCSCTLPSCNSCEVDNSFSSWFNITRTPDGNVSMLHLLDLDYVNGSNITCNQGGQSSWCGIYIIQAYTITECENGVIGIAENATTNITCTGIISSQRWNWTLHLNNGTVFTIECAPNCSSQYDDIMAYNFSTYSTLTVTNSNQQLHNATVTCSKIDNATQDWCEIRTDGLGDPVATSQDPDTQVKAVAGGVTAAVVTAIIILVVVVVLRRKKLSRASGRAENIIAYSPSQTPCSVNPISNDIGGNVTSNQVPNNYDQLSNYLVAGDDIRHYDVVGDRSQTCQNQNYVNTTTDTDHDQRNPPSTGPYESLAVEYHTTNDNFQPYETMSK